MLSHVRAICAAIVATATLILAANAGPARAAEPHEAGHIQVQGQGFPDQPNSD